MSRSFPTEAQARRLGLVALLFVVGAVGCRQDMHDQEKLEPLEASSLFPDGRASRHPVEGTVARGDLAADHHLHQGKESLPAPPTTLDVGEGGGDPAPPPEPEYRDATTFPFEVTRADLTRGRERYDIHCAPCHSKSGHGDGMVVRRGLRRPPSFHIDRLREQTPGYLFDVITRGFGAMPAYGHRIELRDRWAIVAYMRALQLSQNARLEDVPEAARQELAGGGS